MPLDTTFFARFDSNTANNASLNFTGDPAIEITFDFDETAANGGDLFLDANGGLPDDDTVVNIGGTDYNFIFDFSGTLPTRGQGVQQVPVELRGELVYTIIVLDYPTAGETTRLTFLPEADPTETQMNAFGNGAININDFNTNPPPGPVCFLQGTRIATPNGDALVEDLQPGDLVMTADAGPQPVRWISSTEHRWPGSDVCHMPILISRGALGPNLPKADLAVSPQHHILLRGDQCEVAYGASEVLAPAKGLTGLKGVRVMRGKASAVYFHIMLPAHHIVISEGAATESFYPGPVALALLAAVQLLSLQKAFPGFSVTDGSGYGPHCRKRITRKEAS